MSFILGKGNSRNGHWHIDSGTGKWQQIAKVKRLNAPILYNNQNMATEAGQQHVLEYLFWLSACYWFNMHCRGTALR